MYEILIDTGGTFTDGVIVDAEGRVTVAKAATEPADPASSILTCIASLSDELDVQVERLLADTRTILIGTTLATNCILENKGAKCCLIHTEGFRDTFELSRTIPKADIYNLKVLPPKVLIPRHLRFGVEERVQYDGQVVTPLREEDVVAAVRKARDQGVEVPVVCFLHSYINPAHEERAAEIIREEYPNVVVSSRIVRRWIEYDRMSTATLAAYVKPVLGRFVNALDRALGDSSFAGTLLFSTGLGTVATSDVCLENPGHLIGSGLATGALMGRFLGERASLDDVVTCDIGGTSVDIGVLKDRTIQTTTESVAGDQRNALETVEIPSIGAGGGAIAWIDEVGVPRVGPASAGADPGPACYGKGGTEPTLTDANVVLGYIPSDYFLGGAIRLNEALAKEAIDARIAGPLGIDTVEAAHTISSLAETLTAERIFLTVVQKGYDPRDFVLVAAGGAGPVHAIALGIKLGMNTVYIPKHAAMFSALGAAVADYGHVLSRFFYKRDDETDDTEVDALLRSLEGEAVDGLRWQGVEEEDMALVRGAEMRYFGQLRDINVSLPEKPMGTEHADATLSGLVRKFHERHEELYGWADPKLPTTLAMLKVRGVGKRRPVVAPVHRRTGEDVSAALKRTRDVYFKEFGSFVPTPCYDGDRLRHGHVLSAPAIIEERTTTVVVPPGATVAVDRYENYLVTLL